MSELHRYSNKTTPQLEPSARRSSETKPNFRVARAERKVIEQYQFTLFHPGAPDGRGFFPQAGSLDFQFSKLVR